MHTRAMQSAALAAHLNATIPQAVEHLAGDDSAEVSPLFMTRTHVPYLCEVDPSFMTTAQMAYSFQIFLTVNVAY